mgnify:CR=1 FL=1
MKHILFICHTISTGGGSEKVLSMLINELSQYYNITLIERLEDVKQPASLPAEVNRLRSMSFTDACLKSLGKNCAVGRIWRFLLSVFIMIIPSMVYRKYIKGSYDYEISFNYLYSSALVANSRNRNSKKIMWIHGSIEDLEYTQYQGIEKLKYYFLYKMQKRAFDKADKIIPISINTYKSILAIYPQYSSKIEIIYNGYNFNEIKLKSEKFHVPRSRKFRIIAVGRLDKNKNVRLQIETVCNLLERNISDIELYIVGQGEEKQLLEKVAGIYLNRNIFFLGYQSNPYPYIKSSDVLLLTSFSEGFPTVLVEAMCLGVPIITAKVGGAEELVKAGLNGCCLENYSVEELSKSLLYISNDLKKISNEIIQSVAPYTLNSWTENVKNLLERV